VTAVVVALAVVVGVLAVLVVGLLRSHAEILKRLHVLGAGLDDAGSPAAGRPAPPRPPPLPPAPVRPSAGRSPAATSR
jgi:hypothetical protein